MARRLLTYHLTFLMLLTNIGIPVFTHVCLGHGKSWTSAFLPVHRACTTEVVNDAHASCGKAGTCCSAADKTSPCCDNTIVFEQLDIDILTVPVEGYGLMEVSPQALAIHEFFLNTTFSGHISFQPHAPPLPSLGIPLCQRYGVIRC